MELVLRNIMWFSLILLLLALTVEVVQIIIILLDVRGSVREVKKKLKALTSVLDIATLFLAGLEEMKRRAGEQADPSKATLKAFLAGVKKGLQVLVGGEKNE